MSRHRNIRKLDYSDDYSTDDVYGRSLEEEVAISPSTAAEFIYQRDSHESPSLMSYFDAHGKSGTHKKQSSPLATTSTSTARSSGTSISAGHRVPPGFQPIKTTSVKITTEGSFSSSIASDVPYSYTGSKGASLSDLAALHVQSQPPPLPGDQPELMFPHTGMLVGSANPHPSTTDLDSTQLPSLSSLMSSTAQEQRSSVFSPNAQPVAQITHSSALANTVPSLLQLTNQHTGKGSDTFSFHRTCTGFTDKSASSPSLSESVTHATPSPHTPELTHDYCDPSDSYTSQPSSAHSPLSQLAVQHIDSSVKSCINTPRKTPRHTDISESSQGGTSDAHTTCNPQSQLSLLELASQNVTNVTPSIAPDIDQGPTWQSSGTQLATLCQQHLNEPAIKQHSQSKPHPPTSNRPVTTTATTFAFSPFGDSEMTPKQSTGLSLADLARMHDPTVSPSRSPPLSVSSAQSSPTPSLSSLVKSHLAVEAGDTSGDGSPTKDPCQSPSTPSLPTSSSPLSTLLTRRIVADLSEPSSTHSPQLYVGSSLSSLAAQQPVVPRTISAAVWSSPVRVTSSAPQVSRRGFITHGFSLEEERTHSGTPSPSRSPAMSPARSPARSPSPSEPTFNSTPSRHPPLPQRSTSKSKYQQIDVEAEYKKREQTNKAQINLVVIVHEIGLTMKSCEKVIMNSTGHVDAGKSTLMGHLLYLLGNVSKRAMHRYEQESQKVGKSSFAYAWVLDETGEERHRGITMDVAQQLFETKTKLVTLLDAPGHKDFIPNMITGAAQADVALLVVDAAVGEFEAGFDSGGQTREHAILVRSLGVRQLTVAVNKMDTMDWSESRFNDIQQKLKAFLKQAGFKESDISYVPCSGMTGENLVQPLAATTNTKWYKGPTLLDRIDQFVPPIRPIEKPFRCCIADIFKAQGSGFNVAGRIESGHIQLGESVLVLPANEIASIKALLMGDEPASWVVAGDQVVITLTGVDIAKISTGSVLCSVENPIPVTTRVEARIIVFNIDIPITVGFPVLLHYQSVSEPAVVRKLISLLNKSSGEVVKKRPRCLTKQNTAVIQLEVQRPVCLELYQDCKDLGRFMLRSKGNTIAAGMVTKIL